MRGWLEHEHWSLHECMLYNGGPHAEQAAWHEAALDGPYRDHLELILEHMRNARRAANDIPVSIADVWAQWGQSAAIDHAMRKAYDKIRQLIRDYENIFSDKGVHDQKIGPHKEVFFHEQTISKWKRIGGSWECLQPWSMRIWCN